MKIEYRRFNVGSASRHSFDILIMAWIVPRGKEVIDAARA